MNIYNESLKFKMKDIKDYEGQERIGLSDFIDIKSATEDTYMLNKKIYIGLDNIQNTQSIFIKQWKEKDDEILKLKNNEFELKKESKQSIKSIIELSDLIISIYDFAIWQNEKGWIKSLEKTIEKNDEILNKVGLSRIKSLGKRFDVNIHDCKGIGESEDAEPNTIIKVLRQGYRYKGKIYRNPEVIISK